MSHITDEQIQEALKKYNGNKSAAAKLLGIPRSTIRSRLANMNIERPVPVSNKKIIAFDRQKESLQQENRELRGLYKRAIQGLNVQDKLVIAAAEQIKALPPVKQPQFPKKEKGKTTERAILNMSDIHAGEEVSDAEMRGFNTYGMETMNKRIKHCVNTAVDLTLNKIGQGYNLEKLYLFLLGDIVSGIIHEELAETSSGNIVTWTTDVAYILAQSVRDLLMAYPVIDISGVVGNHGRVQKQVRFKERYVNWDFVVYQYLSLFLAEEIKAGKVTCTFPTSFWMTKKIYDWNWLLMHGDNINSWMGIPWYGIIRTVHKLKELLATQKEMFQYINIAHFHNQGTLDMMRGRLIINGSVIGGNEYSIGKMFTTSEACQYFCGFHKDHGITWEFKINLQGKESLVDEPYNVVDLASQSMGELA